ncbi:MAG TPA: SUMF1/EgtB/PvdO family nonheme iron enzyme [Phycisphaerae bacterium]|nr:SUMF1/EgtB/PvdO family nonheme iron enzyme [Phycisphaerae bacterium]
MIRVLVPVAVWYCLAHLLPLAPAQAAPPTIESPDGAKMILVPAGPFIMGSGEGNPDETPPHQRELPAFYLDATEVTGAQYARYLQETGAKPPAHWNGPVPPEGKADHPVTNVTWFDAMRYAIWAGKRLPTEAEWEKAARGTDGRRFPWGNAPLKDGGNLGGGKIRPVGGYPNGASPFGLLDMAGNVWEWTADWYEAYPGTAVRLVHFGQKYKVIRGGGAEYFYSLNENTGRCALRGRILPYAGEDYLGFRCARDVDPGKPAYDAKKLLAEAEAQLKLAMPEPKPLSYEREYETLRQAGRFPIEINGHPGQTGMVRAGVPLPQGLVTDVTRIQVVGPDGKARPTQRQVLTPWRDGSARWVLLDFPAAAGEKCSVNFTAASTNPAKGLQVRTTSDTAVIDTGKAVFTFTKSALLGEMTVGGKAAISGAKFDLVLDSGKMQFMPAEQLEIEAQGPLHTTIRLSGWLADEKGAKSPFHYDVRAHATADSTRLNLLLTLTHLQPRTGETHERTPMARIVDASVRFALPASADRVVMATDLGVFAGPVGGKSELLQPDTTRFTITRDGEEVGRGTRSPGWLAVPTAGGWLSVGVRHFWQNYVKALTATPNEIALRLWAGEQPLDFEATIAKTHELVLEVAPQEPTATQHVQLDPMRVSINPAWACGTQALGGPKVPRCDETIAHIPYWELSRHNGMRRWMRSVCYSWRDFGDTRHGGEHKGANAFHNLEYDVPFNFILQYLGTGETWYLDAAEIQCRHQADIDTDHVTGHPYKHERFHTTWYADFAHMFLRGLVLHYWTTGEQRSLEVARKIADYIAPRAASGEGFGNERQIGWGLYALSGIYEATLDEKYLNAASTLCDRLVSGMSPHGKFKIRWDNRMSLMNGMAMNGMMSVQELTGDEKLADGLLRLANRTLGFYPEYAMRTLHGYAWALARTNDPRFLDVLDKTWQTCMEYLMAPGKDCDTTSEEVHAWRTPWFVVKYGLFPLFDRKPKLLPAAASWRGQWLPGDKAEVFLRTTSRDDAPVMVILQGIAAGKAELLDAAGKVVDQAEFTPAARRLFSPAAFVLPAGKGSYLLRLTSFGAAGWQLHHDGRSIATLYDPKAVFINDLTPRAYCTLRPREVQFERDRGEGQEPETYRRKGVRILFEAVGEGVHSVTLYDPNGNVFATAEKFLPLEDKGRYEISLAVPFDEDQLEGWSIEAWQAKVLRIEGFSPYWANSPEQLFNPETLPE